MRNISALRITLFVVAAICLWAQDSSAITIPSCNPTFTAGVPGGVYTVTAPLVAAPGANCINVTAPGVTIDLNGFTLTGSGGIGVDIFPAATGAYIYAPLTVGGTITGFATGISDAGSSARIEQLGITRNTVTGVELVGVDGSIVVTSAITSNGQYGVYLQNTTNCLVQRNTQISSNGKIGVWIQNTSTTTSTGDNVIAVNELNANGLTGIEVGYTGIPPNCVTGPKPSTGNLIVDNLLPSLNGQYGIALECNTATDNLVTDNTATASGTIDDLFDGNAACDANVWKGDTFATRNQGCIL
jgi:Right handed beta helix region